MVDIKKAEVEQIADVARIALTDEEAVMFASQLDLITDHAERIQEVDTRDVQPTTYVHELTNVMREDQPEQWTTREEVLKNAPDQQNGHFRVPSILE